MTMDRAAMAQAVSYREVAHRTVSVALLMIHPPELAGPVLKATRGLLYTHRGVRNVIDLHAAQTLSGSENTHDHTEDGPTLFTFQEQQWRVHAGAGVTHVKGLLLDPSVLPAASVPLTTTTSPLSTITANAVETLAPVPLSAETAANMGLPYTLVEKLNNALDGGAFSEGKRERQQRRLGGKAKQLTLRVGLATTTVKLTYANYPMAELLRMVLPSSSSSTPTDARQGTKEGVSAKCTAAALEPTSANRVCGGEAGGMNNSMSSAQDVVALSGFEQVGHIAHVNLSRAHLAYKHIIGQVILDGNPTVGVVVNKTDAISSRFREFPMEIIALRETIDDPFRGVLRTHDRSEDELLTATVRQHGCVFEVPYNRVYWNSRLSHEHTRLVAMMRKGDVLFDVMAGVGPFAVPAAKHGVLVYGNDLNPVSAEFMAVNRERNKIDEAGLRVFNWDGRHFMNKVVYDSVMGLSATSAGRRRKHVVMNLPATAVEFLDVFAPHQVGTENAATTDDATAATTSGCDGKERVALPDGQGWYRAHRWNMRPRSIPVSGVDRSLLIHVYCFSSASNALEEAVKQVERHLGYTLGEANKECVFLVRDVAPQKRMVCVSFTLPDAFWAHQVAVDVTGGSDADEDGSTRKQARTE